MLVLYQMMPRVGVWKSAQNAEITGLRALARTVAQWAMHALDGLRQFLNSAGGKDERRMVQPSYDRLLVTLSPDIRKIPFAGSTETVTLPSRICMRRSPINWRRHPRTSGRSASLFFSLASTSA